MEQPTTLQEAAVDYSEFENCKSFTMASRWPDEKVNRLPAGACVLMALSLREIESIESNAKRASKKASRVCIVGPGIALSDGSYPRAHTTHRKARARLWSRICDS